MHHFGFAVKQPNIDSMLVSLQIVTDRARRGGACKQHRPNTCGTIAYVIVSVEGRRKASPTRRPLSSAQQSGKTGNSGPTMQLLHLRRHAYETSVLLRRVRPVGAARACLVCFLGRRYACLHGSVPACPLECLRGRQREESASNTPTITGVLHRESSARIRGRAGVAAYG